MLYFLLTVLLLIMGIFFYRLFKKDIASPTVLSCFIYALSSFAALLGRVKGSWNFQALHGNTFCIVLIGVLFFGLGEFFARKFILKTRIQSEKLNLEKYHPHVIKITTVKLFICYVFVFLTIILIYNNMKRLTGVSGISDVISAYRLLTPFYNPEAIAKGIKISTIYMQMFKACEIIAIIYIYVIVNNVIAKERITKNLSYIFLVFLCAALTFLLGGRSGFLRYAVAAFMIWLILYSRTNKMSMGNFIKLGFKILIVILPAFYLILPLLGRNTDANLYDYITFYLGCPLPSFDVMLQEGITHSIHFGEMTLKGIQALLSKLGMIDYYSLYQANWVYFARGLSSNVFTNMYAPFVDFGIFGILICQFLFGFVFTKLYLWATKLSNCRFLLFYAFYTNQIIDQFRSEKLFTNFIHYNTIIYVILLLILTWFIFDAKGLKGKLYERKG